MKRFILVPALFALLMVVACGGGNPPTKNENYLKDVRTHSPVFKQVTDHNLIILGHEICHSLDQGYTVWQIAKVGIAAGISPFQMGVIEGSAIRYYCPEYGGMTA